MSRLARAFTREEKSWIMYDVGTSAFVMLSATLIPIYFASLTDSGSSLMVAWGFTESAASLLIALIMPILGHFADFMGNKKKFLVGAAGSGILMCAALGLTDNPLIFLILYVIVSIALNGSFIFYDAFLIDAAKPERRNMVSSTGFAWGYIGSCIPFLTCLLIILEGDAVGISRPMGMKISFIVTALWWLAFTIPLARNVKQVHGLRKGDPSTAKPLKEVAKAFSHIIHSKTLLLFVLAYIFYTDSVHAIIKMSAAFGTTIGLSTGSMVSALLLTQLIAFPATIVYGRLANKVGAWKMIAIAIAAYFCVIMYAAFFLHSAVQFWILAAIVGLFQGGIQALSRSYFANLIPPDRSNEFFSIFDLFGKYASVLGTFFVSLATMMTGSPSLGVCSLGVMLAISFVLFMKIPRTARL